MRAQLEQVDNLTMPDHWYLQDNDPVFYFLEYTARKGYQYSNSNQLITNFKKPVDRKGRPEYRYKEQAIGNIASMLHSCLYLNTPCTFVPVPPSKHRSHPEFDDRLEQVLEAYRRISNLDFEWKNLVSQTETIEPFHQSDDRRMTPDELASYYQLTDATPAYNTLVVFDDILTTGSHFKAMQQKLQQFFPGTEIVGLFIARRVIDPEVDFNDFF